MPEVGWILYRQCPELYHDDRLVALGIKVCDPGQRDGQKNGF
jgi:hypothetical protein